MRPALNLFYTHPEDLQLQMISDHCEHTLSEEELARSKVFPFEKNRREYLATRLLVRRALSHYHPLPPQSWKFQTNRFGKPATDPHCGLHFNVSNTSKLIVCLIGNDIELGIDIEPLDRAADVSPLAPEIFSSKELAQLEKLPDSEKSDRALSLWTLKESYIKARGLGLSLPLKKFSFVFEQSNKFHLETDSSLHDDPTNWQSCIFNLADHRCALTVGSRLDLYLQIWEMPPSMTTPEHRPNILPSQPVFCRNLH
jgi:4'-phosphopantetheinyl transferase